MKPGNKKTSGKVYLVGAGPGDPGLLTVKAQKLLESADLIVYDYLANPAHLRHARPDAAKICVGKRFRHQPYSQDRINRLIIASARSGKRVVRLKGGDPYLFGRGGEEALTLFRRGIPFEVVPGVTSATACAAYAGIPLTHRDHNASVTFLTGHRADDEELERLDWKKIASGGGTLVIYMGFYNLGVIAKRLRDAGMPSATPVSVIQWGTLPGQKSCCGTLADISERVLKQRLGPPSIVIVGDVVSLRRELNWFERQPLFGKRILITRTGDKAAALRDRLESRGASVLECPLIQIRPAPKTASLDRAIRRLRQYEWLVFTSTYGVDAFFERLEKRHGMDARALAHARIASASPAAGRALRDRGIVPDLEPRRFETRALAEAFEKRKGELKGRNVLLLRTDIAPTDLEERLRKLGARPVRLAVYRTRMARSVPKEIRKILAASQVDAVAFTSSSTVTAFMKLAGIKNARKWGRKTRWASIGPVTSRTLKSYGLRPSCEAKTFTLDGLVEALENAL